MGFYAPILGFLGVVLVIVPAIVILRLSRDRSEKIRSGQIALTDKYSGLSIAALIVVLFGALPGVILGHLALSQIHRTNERGWGLAVAALYLGYLGLIFGLIAFFFLSSASR